MHPMFPPHHSTPTKPHMMGYSLSSKSDKKNDYCQHFVNSGERPQNFIRDIRPEQRFAGSL